jgi:hypothetical protein
MRQINIQSLTKMWTVTIHDEADEAIPNGAQHWPYADHKLIRHPHILVGYVRRLAKHSGGRGEWHVIPYTSVGAATEGQKGWSLYAV